MNRFPFYTMALHGLVDYTAESYNLSEDASETLLKSIENGAGLYFVLTGKFRVSAGK